MKLPTLTKSQKEIIFHLYKFRYLLIRQLQYLFNHKDPKRIKAWLNDLHQKKYIDIIKDEHNIIKPYIYCLAQKSRHILEQDEDIDTSFLRRIYKEKTYSEEFMQRHLFIADTYIYFLRTKEEASELSFFTQQDLKGYDYFPHELPDAYIDLKVGEDTSLYFLDFFDKKAEPGNVMFRIKSYFKYYDEGKWQNNTENTPFPGILMIFENMYRKKYAHHYGQALLKKSITNDIEIFVALKEAIRIPRKDEDVWVNIEDNI